MRLESQSRNERNFQAPNASGNINSRSSAAQWHAWVEEIQHLDSLYYARFICTSGKNTEILIFGDASALAGYGTIVYARTYNKEKKKYNLQICMARARVNPLKKTRFLVSNSGQHLCALS